jgi:hypothetical protein
LLLLQQRREGIKNIKYLQRLANKERALMAAEDRYSHAENAAYTAAIAQAAAAAAALAASAALAAGVGVRVLTGAAGGDTTATSGSGSKEPALFIEQVISWSTLCSTVQRTAVQFCVLCVCAVVQ